MKDNGQTALSRQTDVAIFALPIIVTSEEVCDASKAAISTMAGLIKKIQVSIAGTRTLYKIYMVD